jgi:hypothetical protein
MQMRPITQRSAVYTALLKSPEQQHDGECAPPAAQRQRVDKQSYPSHGGD